MKTRYWNGRIQLSTGKFVTAHLGTDDCAKAGTCVCGFCKGEGQCKFGDCRGEIVADGATLCPDCASFAWRASLPGHSAGKTSA
jgi:hypothetical protein